MGTKQDPFLTELALKIERMTPHKKIYKVLRAGLTKKGYWHKESMEEEQFFAELEVRVRNMTPQTRTYRVLRDELTKKQYWRRHKRGNPKAGYAAMKAKKQNFQ